MEGVLAATILLAREIILLQALSHESIEVRESASAELYRRGEPAATLLVEVLPQIADTEARGRIEGVLARLEADRRRREFGGGPRGAGFGASLRVDRFYGAGPFRLTLEIMNLSDRHRELSSIGAWEAEFPHEYLTSARADARVVVRRTFGPTPMRRFASKTPWSLLEPEALLLGPGGSGTFEYALEGKGLPEGDYTVWVEYDARRLLEGAEEPLRSNAVRITVRK